MSRTKIQYPKVNKMMPSIVDTFYQRFCLLLLLSGMQLRRNRSKKKKRALERRTFTDWEQKREYSLVVHDLKLFNHEYFFRVFSNESLPL